MERHLVDPGLSYSAIVTPLGGIALGGSMAMPAAASYVPSVPWSTRDRLAPTYGSACRHDFGT
jgi:hypothetical protein